MISDRAIGRAVERGVITADQADGLRAIAREEIETSDPVDEEKLRFVSGFADIFVSIGLILFLGALAFIMDAGAGSTPMYAGLAACAWLLAEFFTFKRRMALPSIVLLVVFVASAFVLSAQVAAALLPQHPMVLSSFMHVLMPAPLPLAVGGLAAAGGAALHYLRFRVPITIAAGVASLCTLVVSLLVGLVPNLSETIANIVLLVCGLATFCLAMRFDMSDTQRVTRRTDIAFWLHLLAAPLIVHPLLRVFLHGLGDKLTTGAALGILWVFLALGALAVVIDRRAILVSGLVYAGIAFGTVIRSLGFTSSNLLVPTVLLALGAFILLLSAGWQPLRRAILRRLPRTLARRLPHPLVASNS